MDNFDHPLSDIVFDLLKEKPVICLSDVTAALGAPAFPERGPEAYEIVAADVLCVLVKQGRIKLIQDWTDPVEPERGGAEFTSVDSPVSDKVAA